MDGWSVSRSDVDQLNEITRTLDEGLRQGALGVGSTIGYAREGITTYEMFEAQRAAARWGRVEDLVGPAVFLASDAAAFVNGQVLFVDGGMTAVV